MKKVTKRTKNVFPASSFCQSSSFWHFSCDTCNFSCAGILTHSVGTVIEHVRLIAFRCVCRNNWITKHDVNNNNNDFSCLHSYILSVRWFRSKYSHTGEKGNTKYVYLIILKSVENHMLVLNKWYSALLSGKMCVCYEE